MYMLSGGGDKLGLHKTLMHPLPAHTDTNKQISKPEGLSVTQSKVVTIEGLGVQLV